MVDKAPLFMALGELELHLPGARSLKDKRQDVRSLVERLKSRLTVLVLETEHQELHQRAGIVIAAMATDAEAARGTVARALDMTSQHFAGVVVDESVTVQQVR